MKIQKISVEGLFGIFDHVIALNLDERITIIHGPNGFGKTAILRMLNAFFNSQYSLFKTIPFSKFRIDFDNGDAIEVLKKSDSIRKNEKEIIDFDFYKSGDSKASNSFNVDQIEDNVLFQTINNNYFQSNIDEIHNSRTYIDSAYYLSLEKSGWVEYYDSSVPILSRSPEEPEWLEYIKQDVNLRLIESQRLLNLASRQSSRSDNKKTPLSTVSAYSEEIAELIQAKLTEYGTTSQSLDRTFPARVVQQKPSHSITEEQLRNQLIELEEKRSRLIQVGLLDQAENSDFQIQPGSIDETTQNILSVYIEDVEKKLGVFEEVFRKIELLRRIINKKFSYSFKVMNLNKETGFVFSTNHQVSSNPKTISPTDLSSGEQHELVLLYELLFKVKPNSLVLIDEPELSLHVGWQSQFLQDLKEITELADLNVLMATHSPDIIQDRWDLTVELKGPEV
ncbi:AAA family ATPase [Spirulina sp. CCNP1310]|uniref:AAA family ATPase n=1 Tax=Spirulina sp. CCNP1310 TaxID=3110249 RepID=UPI003A4C79CD